MRTADKAALVEQICHELEVHTRIEEEIFYPRVRADADGTDELLDEAKVEHQSAKELIAALKIGAPDEGIYDAQVTVLGEYVNHHVKEEERQLFPKVKRSKQMDLAALGEELAERKTQLQ
jgi:iron-sulfur cluster repair protein YtfE (RIC family)